MTDTSYRGQYLVINYLLSLSIPIYEINDDDKFDYMIGNKVHVSAIKSGNLKSKQGKAMEKLSVSKIWMISSDWDKNKVQNTTQHGIIRVMNLHISRWYPNNDQMMRYPLLPHPVFTENMISGTVPKCENNNA